MKVGVDTPSTLENWSMTGRGTVKITDLVSERISINMLNIKNPKTTTVVALVSNVVTNVHVVINNCFG